jgi:hypothetical protein
MFLISPRLVYLILIYKGLNSIGATLAISIRESLESGRTIRKENTFDFLIHAGSHVDELDVLPDVDAVRYELPPKWFAASSVSGTVVQFHFTYSNFLRL